MEQDTEGRERVEEVVKWTITSTVVIMDASYHNQGISCSWLFVLFSITKFVLELYIK